jgi:t-SNARE complex subunit (syntaxin)
MNVTKEFYDYVSNIKTDIKPFSFKCEKYSPMHKCIRLLKQINEADNNIKQITSMSKKSSAFNDHHLKFSSASSNIQRSLIEIENEMKMLKNKDIKNTPLNKYEKFAINNSLEILNLRTGQLTYNFKQFLVKQSELIQKVEKRKTKLSRSRTTTSNYNEFVNSNENNKNEENDVLLNVNNTQIQERKQSKYYESRLEEVKAIEKTMSTVSTMMKRIGEMVYGQGLMIDNISRNTDIAYDNVEKGSQEVKKMLDNVKGNRKLLLKIFLIIIFASVIYILFLA